MSQQKQNLLYVLDSFSHRDVKRWKRQYQAISAYCWDHYSYFAHQRSQMVDALKTSLLSNCISYEFSNWRRAVDNKFNHEPLSARGSILNETGGRFNIGDIDQMKFPKFAGLYLAEIRRGQTKSPNMLQLYERCTVISFDPFFLA